MAVYLLSETHPVGRFKAKFFASLGYSADVWQAREADIRSLLEGEARESERTPYGTKYEVVGELNGPSGAARIVTVWIILRGEDTPLIHNRSSRVVEMNMQILDTVVLEKDLPGFGLKKGDIGAVVEVYAPDGLEVEFVTGSGRTQALVTLKVPDVRPVGDSEILSVRSLDAA